MVVTSSKKHGKTKTKQPGAHEWVTVTQGVNARGWAILPYIIVKGQYNLLSWYQDSQLPIDTTSENSWTTNELGF
ncbi:uncharacterized protein EURHEDRAFT_408958, partial [Aspergillus ruber CBS 135680]